MSDEMEFDNIGADVAADVAKAMEEIEGNAQIEPDESPSPEPKGERDDGRDEAGKFKAKDKSAEIVEDVPKIDAPTSWAADQKEKFGTLPSDVQQYILQREKEAAQGFSKIDDDRKAGKEYRDVLAPFMGDIQANGAQPAAFLKDILTSVQQLKNGDDATKAAVVANVMRQYGVQPQFLQQALQQPMPVQQQFNPDTIKSMVAEQLQQAQLSSQVEKFAADPAHAHFETVKPLMGHLLQNGLADSLDSAYEMAVRAHPQTFSTVQAMPAAKNVEDIAAKKKAGSSVTGSPGISVPNTGETKNPHATIEDDVRAAVAAHWK